MVEGWGTWVAQALSRQKEGLMKLLQQTEHTCAAWLAAIATHRACTSITTRKRSCSTQQASRSEPRDRIGHADAMHRACAKMESRCAALLAAITTHSVCTKTITLKRSCNTAQSIPQ